MVLLIDSLLVTLIALKHALADSRAVMARHPL